VHEVNAKTKIIIVSGSFMISRSRNMFGNLSGIINLNLYCGWLI